MKVPKILRTSISRFLYNFSGIGVNINLIASPVDITAHCRILSAPKSRSGSSPPSLMAARSRGRGPGKDAQRAILSSRWLTPQKEIPIISHIRMVAYGNPEGTADRLPRNNRCCGTSIIKLQYRSNRGSQGYPCRLSTGKHASAD